MFLLPIMPCQDLKENVLYILKGCCLKCSLLYVEIYGETITCLIENLVNSQKAFTLTEVLKQSVSIVENTILATN